MKFSTILAISLHVIVTISVQAQDGSFGQKYGTSEDYRRLYFLNFQYVYSWINGDSAKFNKVLWADDWVQQNAADGILYTKKDMLPSFGTPRFDNIEYFYPEDVHIQFISDDAAMIFAKTPGRAKGGNKISVSQYNDVYVRRNGEWKCVAANISTIATAGETRKASFSEVPKPVTLISYVQGSEEDRATLRRLNDQHASGFATSITDQLEKILARDFILLGTDGLLYNRDEVLQAVVTSTSTNKVAEYQVENMVIRFVAKDMAMIQAAIISTLKDGTKRGTQYNDIYINRDGQWVCVSGNNTTINN